MRTIRAALAAALKEHAGTVNPTILSTLRWVYGELAAPKSIDRLRVLRRIMHNEVALANQRGYSDFVRDMVSVDNAFLKELAENEDS
jgi:hypothetical protein